MKYSEKQAFILGNIFGIASKAEQKQLAGQIEVIMMDTRHACAESIALVASQHDSCKGAFALSHQVVMNTNMDK